jgi:hypothetical protein
LVARNAWWRTETCPRARLVYSPQTWLQLPSLPLLVVLVLVLVVLVLSSMGRLIVAVEAH